MKQSSITRTITATHPAIRCLPPNRSSRNDPLAPPEIIVRATRRRRGPLYFGRSRGDTVMDYYERIKDRQDNGEPQHLDEDTAYELDRQRRIDGEWIQGKQTFSRFCEDEE